MLVQFLKFLIALAIGGAIAVVLSVAAIESIALALDVDLALTWRLSVAAACLAIGGALAWRLLARQVFFVRMTGASGARFAAVIVLGVLGCEALILVLQRLSAWPYPWLALTCLGVTVVVGFFACRLWAFGRT